MKNNQTSLRAGNKSSNFNDEFADTKVPMGTNMNVYEVLRKNLRDLRHSEGLTQKKLADETKIARSSIARYETGENIPPLDVLITLADFFQVTLDELFDRRI